MNSCNNTSLDPSKHGFKWMSRWWILSPVCRCSILLVQDKLVSLSHYIAYVESLIVTSIWCLAGYTARVQIPTKNIRTSTIRGCAKIVNILRTHVEKIAKFSDTEIPLRCIETFRNNVLGPWHISAQDPAKTQLPLLIGLSRHGFPCIWWLAPRAARQKRTLHLCHLQMFFCRVHDFHAFARLLVEVSRFLPAARKEWEWTVRVKQFFIVYLYNKSLDQVAQVVHQVWHCLRSKIFGRCVKHIVFPPRPRPDVLRNENEASWQVDKLTQVGQVALSWRQAFQELLKIPRPEKMRQAIGEGCFSAEDLEATYGVHKKKYPKRSSKTIGYTCGVFEYRVRHGGSLYSCDQSFRNLQAKRAEAERAECRAATACGFWDMFGKAFSFSFDFTALCCATPDGLGSDEIVVAPGDAKGSGMFVEILFPSDKWQWFEIDQSFCKGAGEKLCRTPTLPLLLISFSKRSWSIYLSTLRRCSSLMALPASCDLVLGLEMARTSHELARIQSARFYWKKHLKPMTTHDDPFATCFFRGVCKAGSSHNNFCGSRKTGVFCEPKGH